MRRSFQDRGSNCQFFRIVATKSFQRAADVLQTIEFGPCFAGFVFDNPGNYRILANVSQDIGNLYSGNRCNKNATRNYTDFPLKKNLILPFIIFSHCTEIYSPQKWERYAPHAASTQCVDANNLLAAHYSLYNYRDKRNIERHVRIAANARRSEVQSICHRLFGGRAEMSKVLVLIEESHNAKTENKISEPFGEQSKKKTEDSHA